MIVYAEREELVSARSLLSEIQASTDPLERLIRFGQFEAAAADALSPEFDDLTPELQLLRNCARDGNYNAAGQVPVPPVLRVRPPEGYAYYALHPDMYAKAAGRFFRECRPKHCVIAGIRSIGTSLSTVVERTLAAEGCHVSSFTVRPRGQPFDRRVELGNQLCDTLTQVSGASWFAVVDEGPGMSGSSFIAAAEALRRCGAPAKRIVLFPSHEPDPASFVSANARVAWPSYRRYLEPFTPPVVGVDLSAGAWRQILAAADVPVNPQHERRKYLHEGVLWKFSGFAHLGRSRFMRAEQLAEQGFTPPPVGFEEGFLKTHFIEAQAGRPPEKVVARYLVYLATEFSTGLPPDIDAIREMVWVNTGLSIPNPPSFLRDVSTVRLDARMLPQEWLRTSAGLWLKADALDHHDDHFWPGCQDIAWDIAASIIELGSDPHTLVGEYLRLRSDPNLHERVHWYQCAYLAHRIGYCRMFADADEGRFGRMADNYTATLERTVATLPSSSSA